MGASHLAAVLLAGLVQTMRPHQWVKNLFVFAGLIEVFWAAYFSSEYKDVAAFAILVLVLIFRPTGLLGKPEIEKV